MNMADELTLGPSAGEPHCLSATAAEQTEPRGKVGKPRRTVVVIRWESSSDGRGWG